MQRFFAILGHWLHSLAFAAWFGGMLAIGALVAPTAFDINRPFAGQVLESVFRKLNTLSFFCAAIMLAATWAEWRVRGALARRLLFVRAVLTAAALALALYLGLRLLPFMVHLRSAGAMGDFDRLHHIYEAVSQTQFWLLAIGAALTAYIALPRKAGMRGKGSGIDEGGEGAGSQGDARTPERPNARRLERLTPGAPRP
jgi:uncharacterized protein DUF4149